MSLYTKNRLKNWDGIIEYSFDDSNYDVWDGTKINCDEKKLGADDSKNERYYIYLRGTGNTYITGFPAEKGKEFALKTVDGRADVIINGDFKNLLNYPDISKASMGKGCFSYLFYFDNDNVNKEYDRSPIKELGSAFLLPDKLSQECFMGMFMGCSEFDSSIKLDAVTLDEDCYNRMFANCTSLSTAPVLPSLIVPRAAYKGMFHNCTSLKEAPELPATVLGNECYMQMFQYCTNLVQAMDELPAVEKMGFKAYMLMFANCSKLEKSPALLSKNISSYCYSRMFENCTSLTTPSALPATELDMWCYSSMFYGCSNLSSIPYLPAQELITNCYMEMFKGCSMLDLSDTKSDKYSNEFYIGNGTTYEVSSMFENTCPLFENQDPTTDTTYYVANPVIR